MNDLERTLPSHPTRSRYDKGRITKAYRRLGLEPGVSFSVVRRTFLKLWHHRQENEHGKGTTVRQWGLSITNAYVIIAAVRDGKSLPQPAFIKRHILRRIPRSKSADILAGVEDAILWW